MEELVPHIMRAESTVRKRWREVARTFTLGWGTVEEVEEDFPFLVPRLRDIRHLVVPTLPVLAYQTRQDPPERTVFAIPYVGSEARFDTRLLATSRPEMSTADLLNDFSQCFWFLLDTGVLPSALDEPDDLERTLVQWTGRALLE